MDRERVRVTVQTARGKGSESNYEKKALRSWLHVKVFERTS